MNTRDDRTDEGAILDGIDNYKMTLGSMCALAHVLEKYYGAESRIAPAMYPSRRGGIRAAGPRHAGHGIAGARCRSCHRS